MSIASATATGILNWDRRGMAASQCVGLLGVGVFGVGEGVVEATPGDTVTELLESDSRTYSQTPIQITAIGTK